MPITFLQPLGDCRVLQIACPFGNLEGRGEAIVSAIWLILDLAVRTPTTSGGSVLISFT